MEFCCVDFTAVCYFTVGKLIIASMFTIVYYFDSFVEKVIFFIRFNLV